MAVSFPERVASHAQQVNVVRLLLSILMVPFYVVGFSAGVVWLLVSWVYSGVVVGFRDVRRKLGDG